MLEKPYKAAQCNICGSDRYRRVHYFKEWNSGRERVHDVSIIRCSQCGVRRRMPEIVDDYEAAYHEVYVEQGQAMHPHQLSHFADLMTARWSLLAEKQGKFLDVGCSTGRVLRLAATLGFEPTGLDLSHWACDYCAKQGFATRQGSLIGQWPEGEVFDVIHSCHTIEHVPDPIAYLGEMNRLLKHGGHLMLACPNYASFARLVEHERWIWHLDSHLWQFTKRQMRRMLIRTGFKIFSVRTLHGFTPRNRLKKWALDGTAVWGYGDGLNLIATRP